MNLQLWHWIWSFAFLLLVEDGVLFSIFWSEGFFHFVSWTCLWFAVIGSGLCINLVVAVATSRVFLQKNVRDSQQAEQVSENGGIPQVISIKERPLIPSSFRGYLWRIQVLKVTTLWNQPAIKLSYPWMVFLAVWHPRQWCSCFGGERAVGAQRTSQFWRESDLQQSLVWVYLHLSYIYIHLSSHVLWNDLNIWAITHIYVYLHIYLNIHLRTFF